MTNKDEQRGNDGRAVVTDARILFEGLDQDLCAAREGVSKRECVVDTDDGPVEILREKLFAHSPEGLDHDAVVLVLGDPHSGVLVGELTPAPQGDLSLNAARIFAGELERRWNIYPLLVQALRDLRAYVGEPTGEDGVIEIRLADHVLARVDNEERP